PVHLIKAAISYAVFCLKKKKRAPWPRPRPRVAAPPIVRPWRDRARSTFPAARRRPRRSRGRAAHRQRSAPAGRIATLSACLTHAPPCTGLFGCVTDFTALFVAIEDALVLPLSDTARPIRIAHVKRLEIAALR